MQRRKELRSDGRNASTHELTKCCCVNRFQEVEQMDEEMTNKIIDVFDFLCRNCDTTSDKLHNIPKEKVEEITYEVADLYLKHGVKDSVDIVHNKYSGDELAFALCVLYEVPLVIRLAALEKVLNSLEIG